MAGREKVVTRGLVLRETLTKESDKILTVLTPDLGKIGVVAKGVQKQKSRMSAAAQLLVYAEMTLQQHGDWFYMTEASVLEQFSGLRADMEKLALGSYLAELAEAVTESGQEEGPVLRLTLNALYALSTLEKPEPLVKAAFEWRLMGEIGQAPYAEGCAVCGKEMPEDPVLDLQEGQVFCRSCRPAEEKGIGMPLCPDSLRALRYVLEGPDKKLYSFSLEGNPMHRFSQAAEAYGMAQLERGFPTLDFYKKLKKTTKELLTNHYESDV